MPNSKRTISKYFWFSFFLAGVLLTVVSWFLNNAIDIKPVLNILAPKYVAVKDIFDQLDQTEESKVPIGNQGAQILLQWWTPKPPIDALRKVTFIGRSTGIFNIITGRHRYELRLVTESDGSMFLMQYIWQDYDAKQLMQKELNSRLLKWKAGVFLLGLFISILSGWEFFKSRTEQTEQPDEQPHA